MSSQVGGRRQEACASFASLCVKDTSHVGLLVPGSLRSESVAVEDDVLLSFSSPRNEGDQVSSRCCHDNGRR